jgi:hypothetical protein
VISKVKSLHHRKLNRLKQFLAATRLKLLTLFEMETTLNLNRGDGTASRHLRQLVNFEERNSEDD